MYIVKRLFLTLTFGAASTAFCGTPPNGIPTLGNVNEQDSSGETYLMKAARSGNIEGARVALAKGADVKVRSNSNLDAIVYSAMNEFFEITELIHQAGVDESKVDLSYILKWGNDESVEQLIDLGCNPNYKGVGGVTPLYESVRSQNKNIFPKLLKAGADINLANDDGGTVLHAVIFAKDNEKIQLCLGAKANINLKNENGKTPLFLAAEAKNYTLMKTLLEMGADINATDGNNATVVFVAMVTDDLDMFKMLLKYSPDCSIKSDWGTALEFAEKRKLTRFSERLKN